MDHLAVGTREGFLIGYDVDNTESNRNTEYTTLRYAYAAHEQSIRCIAGSYPILVTASADESIKVYQLEQRQELATLYDHEAAVQSVDIQPQIGLLSGGQDGKVLYYPYERWSKPRFFKGHTGSVHSVSLHPTGRIGLSVGRDSTLQLWKTNGECVCSMELAKEAFLVKWIDDGERWIVATQTNFAIHSLQNGLIQQWDYPSRLVCLCARNDMLVVGGMDGHLRVYKIGQDKPIQVYKVDGGSMVKGVGLGKQNTIYSLSSKGVLEARDIQGGAYRWIEQLPLAYLPSAFHVSKGEESSHC